MDMCSGLLIERDIQAGDHLITEKPGDNCKLWLEKHVLGENHFCPARTKSLLKK